MRGSIFWLNRLFEAPPGIAAEDLDATRTPGIGEYDRFGIGTAHAVGLSRALPLVEERTEAARINLPFRSAVDDAEKLVPVARRIEERHVRARPVGFGLQGVEEILFRAAVAAVVIVEAHRLFEEIVREAHLRRHGRARTEKQQEEKSLHGNLLFNPHPGERASGSGMLQ